MLGGIVRIDLLECEAHPSTPDANHIRITSFTNLPQHITSTKKALEIFDTEPAKFKIRKSMIEVCVSKAVGGEMLTALELEVKSTGNSERNTIEIVMAGLGFVAIGGNFQRAKVRVSTPAGRGIGIRRPVVERIANTGSSLLVVRRKTPFRAEKIKQGGGLRVPI